MLHNLFKGKSLKEQDHILKYFYLIDSKDLAKRIHNRCKNINIFSDTNSVLTEANIDVFFNVSFEELYTYIEQYLNFIPESTKSYSFFGESAYAYDNEVMPMLLKLSLYNFCISEGFFYFLEKENFYDTTKTNSYDKEKAFRPLSACHESYFKLGFFSGKNSIEMHDKIDAGSCTFQTWTHHASTFLSQDNESFLHYVVKDLSKNSAKEDTNYYLSCISNLEKTFCNDKQSTLVKEKLGFSSHVKRKIDIYVPCIYKFPIYKYYKEQSLSSLSRNITRTLKADATSKKAKCSDNTYKNIIYLYNNLYNNLYDLEVQNSNPKTITVSSHACFDTDSYIFRTFNERYFGFSTFSYISNLLAKSEDSSSDYYKYRGEEFNNTLKNLANCPLVYSRHFFLEYALEAIIHNESLERGFLTTPTNAVGHISTPSKTLNSNEKISKGLALLTKYFQMLNEMTLPIISALWTTTMEHLKFHFEQEMQTPYYQKYIDKHFYLLTADFTKLKPDELKDCFSQYQTTIPDKKKNLSAFWLGFVPTIENVCRSHEQKNLDNLKALAQKNVAIKAKNDLFTKDLTTKAKPKDKLADYLSIPQSKEIGIFLRDFLLLPQQSAQESSNKLPPYKHVSLETSQNTSDENEILQFQRTRIKNIFETL